MSVRAILVDDEPLARERIRLLAREEPDLEIVAEFPGGPEALAWLERERADLVFLDVQMPEMDGFQVLERIPRDRLPVVVFTTAYDRHAVRAFEEHALDYLLKPLKPERFRQAVQRVREHLEQRRTTEATRGLLDLLASRQAAAVAPAARQWLTRIPVRTDDRVVVIKTAEIDSIESAGNYVSIQVGKESHILRETLGALEEQLDPERFLRISRGAIVNLDRIKELQPMFKGEHVVVLQNGRRLAMTRGLREVERALRFS